MSAGTSKATFKPLNPIVGLPPQSPDAQMPANGRDAFQALLAFSALQEQARHRQAWEKKIAASSPELGKVEHFVLDEVLQLVAERAKAITGADGIAIALAEDEAIVCRGSAGDIAPDRGVRINPNAGFSGACLVSGQVVRCDDAETDPRVNVEACRRLGVRSMVAVPISARDTVVGLLEAFSREPYGFNDSDLRSLSLLSELVLAAIKPEEEDRLAEISRRVVGTATQTEDAGVKELNSESVSVNEVPPGSLGLAATELSPAVAEDASPPSSDDKTSHPGLALVIAFVILAAALGGMLWWSIRVREHETLASSSRKPVASRSTVLPEAAPNVSAPVSAPPVEDSSQNQPEDEATGKSVSEETGRKVLISGIRHWSSAGSSTVVVDLADQVQYEAHRLTNPDRIYFDLHGTTASPALSPKPIETGDALVTRIRAAESGAGITRVVLETKPGVEFSVRLEQNPYRLVIEVYQAGTKPQTKAAVSLFGPVTTAPAAGRPTVISVAKPSAETAAHSAFSGVRIALDAGHGGWDLGTVGRQGLLEKDLVLDIVGRLGKLLNTRLGVDVIYTRKDDEYLALEKRAEIANISQAELFVSVHANYSDDHSARGVETYYTNTYSSERARSADGELASVQNINWTAVDIRQKVRESHRFAASVQHALYDALAAQNPGIRNRGVKQAQYAVLTGTTMPAILAEVSFVSSPIDETALQREAYRQRIAEALYSGIAHYLQMK